MSEFKTPSGKTFNWMQKAFPGMSWAHAPGKFPWDKPPKMVDMGEVLDFVENMLTKEEVVDGIQKSLLAGSPPLVVGKYIAKLGVMKGWWNPDIAEPLGEALSIPVFAIGEASDIEMESSVPEPSLETDIAIIRSNQAKEEAKDMAELERKTIEGEIISEKSIKEEEEEEEKGLMSSTKEEESI